MMRPIFTTAATFLALSTAALAQSQDVIIVPLDPLPGEDSGLLPTDPVAGFEPLPDDPGTNWQPELEPIDPDSVGTLVPLGEDDLPGLELFPQGAAVGQDVTNVQETPTENGTGAVLKGLDKLAGVVKEMDMSRGETVALGWLAITLGECRYPEDNPSGDAFAWLDIVEDGTADPVFSGWMIASSPGLNALDHPRFDVWVLNCTMPPGEEAASE